MAETPEEQALREHLESLTAEELAAEIAASDLKFLREKRDLLLAETDWWANSDLTMTQAQRDYRQALRDITDNYSDYASVVWPTKP